MLGPRDDIVAGSTDWGIDFEAEVAVIVDDVAMGVSAAAAGGHIKLVMLVNDVSLRNLIPGELGKGFGFLHGKPPPPHSGQRSDHCGFSSEATATRVLAMTDEASAS